MSGLNPSVSGTGDTLEIIAFRLHGQAFCVRTTTIREIRGWGPATPIPHAPPDVIGVMNLRGMVIPIIDLANKLGMDSSEPTQRSAIVVAEIHGMAIGLIVDGVSDILTVSASLLQPVPEISISPGMHYADGIIAQPDGMVCFLNLERMFEREQLPQEVAA
ncbi:chemotaxis protein CheW [Rhizobium sp. NFR03]|uniref:chemotaxis protein CheW n=1 Tax=Rhizobium sp. NFR03 TaxID=1566263 RepID=UPI0008AE80AE|nr:chemotaxis protein CheW [Rhizobium sp. NFR03]SES26748.1 purine-binding chemotaxis protein CheW [Rhizobium sp. NFR03]